MKKYIVAGTLAACFSVMFLHAGDIRIGVKFFGLTIHPQGVAHPEIMPLKFDENGYAVMNLGGTVSAEYFIWKDIVSVRVVQGLYADCASRLGGFSHIGLRGRIFQSGRHSLNGGIGPTFVYRRNWYKIPGFTPVPGDSADFYTGGTPEDDWQWRFIIYGGEFEYNYAITERLEASLSVIPSPEIITFSVGARYRL